MELPLFPLTTVLLPGGPLRLRIFEPRYLDMISACMRNDTGFVVLSIKEGGDTGDATFHDVGTLAQIADWHQYEDGVLGITAIGSSRVRVLESFRQDDGLNVGSVDFIAPDPALPLPDRFRYLAQLLEQLLSQLSDQYAQVDENFEDSTWVASRLAEILPLKNEQKQVCLELTQPLERLEMIGRFIDRITEKYG